MKGKRSNYRKLIEIWKTANNNSIIGKDLDPIVTYCLDKINCYQLILFIVSSGHVTDWEWISSLGMLLECQSGILFAWSTDRLGQSFMLLRKNESPFGFAKGLFQVSGKLIRRRKVGKTKAVIRNSAFKGRHLFRVRPHKV